MRLNIMAVCTISKSIASLHYRQHDDALRSHHGSSLGKIVVKGAVRAAVNQSGLKGPENPDRTEICSAVGSYQDTFSPAHPG
jgi:hypothetical protein